MARAVTVVGGALLLPGCESAPISENPMTLAWQRAHCPSNLDLRPFTARDGRLFEATVLNLGGEQLYIPTEWMRRPGVAPWSAPPMGVRAVTGGVGKEEPWLNLEEPGDEYHPLCLGIVHQVKAGKPDRRDPDFNLSLKFQNASTDTADSKPRDLGGKTFYAFQAIRFNYMATGNPNRIWDGSPAMVYPLTPGPGVVELGDKSRPLRALEMPGGWFLSFAMNDRISAHFQVTEKVDRQRWLELRDKVDHIYAWLKTPPAARDNDTPLTF